MSQVRNENPSWRPDDPRIAVFGQLYNGFASAFSVFDLAYIEDDRFWREVYPGINRHWTGEGDLVLFRKNLETFAQSGLMSSIASAVEPLIRKCLRIVAPGRCDNGRATSGSVRNAFFAVLRKPSLPALPANHEETLDVFYWIRNTVHNNGYFLPPKSKSQKGTYEGIEYDFQDGELLVSKHRLIIKVFEKIGELLYCVVMHPAIRHVDARKFAYCPKNAEWGETLEEARRNGGG
jgi:hypothetical protein